MKTQRIAMIALAVAGTLSGAAYADPAGITLYGVLDAGLANVQHQGDTMDGFPATVNPFSPVKAASIPSTTPVTGVVNGGLQDSRWGLRGSEDLGDGTKAIFTLESGINLPTGQLNNADAAVAAGGTTNAANSSLSGQLFNRQAWIGLEDETLGRLTVGRQYMPIYDILTRYDNVQFAQLLSPLSFSGGLGGGIGVSEDMREDNSLKYSNTINGFNFGALYKFGGVSGHTGARSDYALNVGYEVGGFGVQAAYERLYDGIKASATGNPTTTATATVAALNVAGAPGIKTQVYNSVGYLIAVKYAFEDPGVTLRGGFTKFDLTNGDLTTAQMGVTQFYGNNIENGTTSNQTLAAGSTASTRVVWLGGDYKLDGKNMFSLGLYNVQQDGDQSYAPSKTVSDNGQAQYTGRYYSFLYDHNLSKRTDLYAGITFAEFSNYGTNLSQISANAYSTNRILLAGMRTKF